MTYIGFQVLTVLVFIIIGGALINQIKNIPVGYRFIIIVILLNLLLTSISPTWSILNIFSLDNMINKTSTDYWSIRGQIGDVLSGHFAALAFIALLITISKMQESITKQDEAIKMQQKYIKKQEFENHFFKLYDEFELELKYIKKEAIFESYSHQIGNDKITNIEKFKEWIYLRKNYPKSYFNLLNFALKYIYENQKDDNTYKFLIKNKLSNLDLTYIALHDICRDDNNFSTLLKELDIYEDFDIEDDDIINEILLLKDYSSLKNKLKIYIK